MTGPRGVEVVKFEVEGEVEAGASASLPPILVLQDAHSHQLSTLVVMCERRPSHKSRPVACGLVEALGPCGHGLCWKHKSSGKKRRGTFLCHWRLLVELHFYHGSSTTEPTADVVVDEWTRKKPPVPVGTRSPSSPDGPRQDSHGFRPQLGQRCAKVGGLTKLQGFTTSTYFNNLAPSSTPPTFFLGAVTVFPPTSPKNILTPSLS